MKKRFYLPSRRLMNVLSEVNTKFGFGKIILPPLSISIDGRLAKERFCQ